MITFSCTCGHKYQVSEKYAGKKVRCKHCNAIIQVPSMPPQEEQKKPLSDGQDEYISAEYGSKKKIWCMFALLISVFCIVIAFLFYVQHYNDKKEKALYATCEALVDEADTLIKQDELEHALEKYVTVRKLISDSEFNSSEINYLLEDSEDQIQTLKNIIFANKHLPELKNIEKEANTFFSNGDFDSAVKKYIYIIAFINKNQKQEDTNFNSLQNHSEKRLAFINNLKKALAYNQSDLSKLNRTDVDELYVELIKELSSLKHSCEENAKVVAKLENMKYKAVVYYNKMEGQMAIAKREEEYRRKAEESRRDAERKKQLAAKMLKKQEEAAAQKIKEIVPMLSKRAKEIIKSSLKAPSTSSFENTTYKIFETDSSIRNVLVAELDDMHGDYTHYSQLKQKYPDGLLVWFSGEVNAHNSFGAMIQNHWWCAFFYSSSQDYYEFFKGDVQ